MGILPPYVVPAPEPRGLRYGLFVAAAGPLELPPHGFGGGVLFQPVSCGSASLLPVECDDTPPEQVFDPADPLVEALPFLARATYVCGSAGTDPATMEAKVRRRLANGEQSVAEAGLATALAAAAVPLAAPDPSSFDSAVGELEQWLYGAATADYGNVGYLHAPVRYAGYASRAGLVVRDGQGLLRTPMGTVWVFGGGYPDDGTVYVSGHVTVWRTTDVLVPPPEQTFDRRLNQYRLIADRGYAVAYDCVAAAATFDPELTIS